MTPKQPENGDVVIWALTAEQPEPTYIVKVEGGPLFQFEGRDARREAHSKAHQLARPGVRVWTQRADGTYELIR
jgi:hypothetical protein